VEDEAEDGQEPAESRITRSGLKSFWLDAIRAWLS
jgi:hypothetical protein